MAFQVPFSDHGSLITGLLQQFWECLLTAVESGTVIEMTVYVTVLAGQKNGTARSTNGIGDKTLVKHYPFTGNPIDIWSICLRVSPKATNPIIQIIYSNQYNIRSFLFLSICFCIIVFTLREKNSNK